MLLVKRNADKRWAFSNIMSVIKYQLMTYIDLFKFLKYSETNWDILNNINQTKLDLFET
jgi:hypothetical protein